MTGDTGTALRCTTTSCDCELFNTASVFVNAANLFESVDQERLQETQHAEYGEHIDYILDSNAPIPERETITSISYYSVHDGLVFKSYLPDHLRKRSTFRDQLVLPNALIGLVLHAYHDHPLSGGHLAFGPTYDKIRQKWWPTMNRDALK